MVKKVFIDYPYSGLDETVSWFIRDRLKKLATKMFGTIGVAIIFSDDCDGTFDLDGGLQRLGEVIKLMGEADVVLFSSDWYKDKDCKIRMNICQRYGKLFVVEGVNHGDD